MASLQELLAASALIVRCEKLCTAGVLSGPDEEDLRRLIVKCCVAFEIPTIAERPAAPDNVVALRHR